jgi:hypothetical protein
MAVICVFGAVGIASADEPPRVSGVSKVIDAAQTGQHLGPNTGYGLAQSALGIALASAPPEAQPVTDQVFPVLAVPPEIFAQLEAQSGQGYDALRQALAPAAAANPQLNTVLDTIGQAMIGATPVHQVIQPLDRTMIQAGEALIALEEK